MIFSDSFAFFTNRFQNVVFWKKIAHLSGQSCEKRAWPVLNFTYFYRDVWCGIWKKVFINLLTFISNISALNFWIRLFFDWNCLSRHHFKTWVWSVWSLILFYREMLRARYKMVFNDSFASSANIRALKNLKMLFFEENSPFE